MHTIAHSPLSQPWLLKVLHLQVTFTGPCRRLKAELAQSSGLSPLGVSAAPLSFVIIRLYVLPLSGLGVLWCNTRLGLVGSGFPVVSRQAAHLDKVASSFYLFIYKVPFGDFP